MQVIHTIKEMRQVLKDKKEIGLVPTMGNLHAGHLSLVAASNQRDQYTVVSIFVNPTQFGPQEDYLAYPRTLEADLEKLSTLKVDYVFNPQASEMYRGQTVYVEEYELANELCGRYRPGHFKGVLTVVLKFFNIINPRRAYFGKKDYQQWRLIDKMVQDLDLDLEVIGCPIVRDRDGLALSSRNSYLNTAERANALSLNKAIRAAQGVFRQGERQAVVISELVKEVLSSIRVQYIECVDPVTLKKVSGVDEKTLLALAGFAGKTRLIDNAVFGEDLK